MGTSQNMLDTVGMTQSLAETAYLEHMEGLKLDAAR